MDGKVFKTILEKQLELASTICFNPIRSNRIKAVYENLYKTLGWHHVGVHKHIVHDGVFYIELCSHHGYRVIKFYDNNTYRFSGYHTSVAEAHSEAVCYM